jgi:hypothetical protein
MFASKAGAYPSGANSTKRKSFIVSTPELLEVAVASFIIEKYWQV